MLKLLRKKKVAKRIFYVLAGLIIPAFVIWGSASVINKDQGPDSAGILFGKKVSYEEFRAAMTAWKTQMRLQYGEEAEKAFGTMFDPMEGAWDRLILLHEAKKRNIRISDKELVETITSLPFLQQGGRFDNQTYDLFLKYSAGLSARQFEEQMRQNLAMARIYKEVTAPVSLSDEETRREYEEQSVQTRVKYVLFSPSDDKKNIKVSEEEIRQYYENFRDKFRVPPQINVLYAFLNYREGMSPEEEKETEEKMKNVLKAAKASNLREAASEAGIEVKETGFFGFDDPVPGLGWMPQLKTLLFDTPQGSLTDVLATDHGIYLFSILEKKSDYIPEFKEAKTRVKDVLLEEKATQAALQKAKDFLDKVGKEPDKKAEETAGKKNKKPALPATFEKAAQAEGLAVKETAPFSRASYIPELGMANALKEAAFSLKKDEIYPKAIIVSQGFCVIQSMETPVFDEEKFNKEKDEFKKALLEQKRSEAFNRFFTGLKKEANLISYVKPLRQVAPASADIS
ncbi:MAG: SurA N-terminal domain-containing protein [Candidatus Omnitrophota bacterium]